MRDEFIHKEALRIVRKYGTRNPFRIAEDLGIDIIINNAFDELKGMYKVIKRCRFIFINGNLGERDQRTICAHELGHDRFHRDLATADALQHYRMYDTRSMTEYEANIFAAELLIDEDNLFELLRCEYDLNHIASELGVDFNLLLIKIDELRKQGCDVRVPFRPRSDFLRYD